MLEEEKRVQRGDQEEIDMMAASDNATCHTIFSTAVVFPYHKPVISTHKEHRPPPPFREDKIERRFIRGAQKIDMVATMEVGFCRKTFFLCRRLCQKIV